MQFTLLAMGPVPPIPPSMMARPPHGTQPGRRRALAGGAANTEPALRAEREALSALSFIDLWWPVRERYPELIAFNAMLASILPTAAGGDADFSRLRGTKSGYRSNPLVPHSKGSVGRLASSSPTSWTYPARYPQARHDNNIKGEDPLVTGQQGRTLAMRPSSGNKDALYCPGYCTR
jgi:hypothetical protein